MKIGVELSHRKSLAIMAEAGVEWPRIHDCNTAELFFVTAEGKHALCINQGGFQAEITDDEEECNGCSVLVLEEPGKSAAEARGILRKFLDQMMGEEP